MGIIYFWDNTGDPITAIPNNWPKCGKNGGKSVAKPFPCHLTVMSRKIDFVIKGNEKVKLCWIEFIFLSLLISLRGQSWCQIRMFVKKSEHVQFPAVPVVIAWEILKLTLGGGLIKFRWSKFYSAGVYFQLKLHALTHAEWPISFHFLFQGETDGVLSPGHPGFASRTIPENFWELLVPIRHFPKALVGL